MEQENWGALEFFDCHRVSACPLAATGSSFCHTTEVGLIMHGCSAHASGVTLCWVVNFLCLVGQD